MLIWVYRLLFLPAFVLLLPRYLLRMWRRGGYGKDFAHRLGRVPRLPPPQKGRRRLWIQAVSVGEIQALGGLLQLLSREPHLEIVLTTTTSTGYAIARERYGASLACVALFPLDFWPCAAAAWKRFQPDAVVLMEGELWPEHLYQAQCHRCPAFLINARMSDRSFRRHQRFPAILRQLLPWLTDIAASSPEDASRYVSLGAPTYKVWPSGNLKCDASPPPLLPEEIQTLRESLGFTPLPPPAPPPLVLLGASTWPGEELFLIEVLEEALARGMDCRLLLVPRHAERRQEIARLLASRPHLWHQRSTQTPAPSGTRIHLADTTGELTRLTQTADLAFIGKSLPPNEGGQTPIEAAAFGIPLVYGPNMGNFRHICQTLEQSKAARRAATSEEARQLLLELLLDAPQRHAMTTAAGLWHRTHAGAAQRTAQRLLAPPASESRS